MKNARKLQLPSGLWYWGVGRSSIWARSPKGCTHVLRIGDVVGLPEHIVEHEAYKRNLHITPRQVAHYINRWLT